MAKEKQQPQWAHEALASKLKNNINNNNDNKGKTPSVNYSLDISSLDDTSKKIYEYTTPKEPDEVKRVRKVFFFFFVY